MTNDTFDFTLLQQWVGNTETCDDLIGVAPVSALAATLNRQATPGAGAPLPPLWHWICFWPVAPQAQIGSDGHPKRGGFLPPIPLPRRMWAGGRLKFDTALPVGCAASRSSRILDVQAKTGRSGHLAFVTVRHEISHEGGLSITEEQDIVYRDMPLPGAAVAPGVPAPAVAAWSRQVEPDPVLLFRYSALTFNAHRIHYDRDYASAVEGYPGLVVHGPLIATLLADLLQGYMPNARLAEFNFRAIGPLFDTEPFTLCGQPDPDGKTVRLWAKNPHGNLAMQAEAILAD
jgi:3-methylfumaryl-CoA hydratase